MRTLKVSTRSRKLNAMVVPTVLSSRSVIVNRLTATCRRFWRMVLLLYKLLCCKFRLRLRIVVLFVLPLTMMTRKVLRMIALGRLRHSRGLSRRGSFRHTPQHVVRTLTMKINAEPVGTEFRLPLLQVRLGGTISRIRELMARLIRFPR